MVVVVVVFRILLLEGKWGMLSLFFLILKSGFCPLRQAFVASESSSNIYYLYKYMLLNMSQFCRLWGRKQNTDLITTVMINSIYIGKECQIARAYHIAQQMHWYLLLLPLSPRILGLFFFCLLNVIKSTYFKFKYISFLRDKMPSSCKNCQTRPYFILSLISQLKKRNTEIHSRVKIIILVF